MFKHHHHHHHGHGPHGPGPFGGPFGRRHHGHGGPGGPDGHGGPGRHSGPWGARGFGRGFGPWGGPGGGRRFGKGDLKYVILDLLNEGPRHGYDIIRALEERGGGFYSPSPGSVYPTLQLLDDQGYVRATEQDGKRVYAITDEGRAFLAEHAATVEGLRDRMREGWGPLRTPEMAGLIGEMRDLGGSLFHHGARGALNDPEKVARLRDVIARARKEIEAILDERTTTV